MKKQTSNKIGLSEAVLEAAHEKALSSLVPGIREAATLVAVLLRLTTDYGHNARDVENKARWCHSVMVLLESAWEVIGNVSSPDVGASHGYLQFSNRLPSILLHRRKRCTPVTRRIQSTTFVTASQTWCNSYRHTGPRTGGHIVLVSAPPGGSGCSDQRHLFTSPSK